MNLTSVRVHPSYTPARHPALRPVKKATLLWREMALQGAPGLRGQASPSLLLHLPLCPSPASKVADPGGTSQEEKAGALLHAPQPPQKPQG